MIIGSRTSRPTLFKVRVHFRRQKAIFLESEMWSRKCQSREYVKASNEFDNTYDKQAKRYIGSVLSCTKHIDKKPVYNILLGEKQKL